MFVLEKLIVTQLVRYLGRFVTVFTSARH